MGNSLIKYSLTGKEDMTEMHILNRLPDENEWIWCYGSELIINTKKQTYILIYIDNTEYGLLFYNKSLSTILYYEELEEIKNKEDIQEIKIIVPSPKKLVQNYLKGLTVNTILATDEIKLNEKKLEFYKETIKFLSELNEILK